MPFDRRTTAAALADLARDNVFVGTSSWKYPGWMGPLYDEQRYLHRGRFSESRFEKNCLAEYAEVFPTVCVDAGYYRFPTARYLGGLAAQVPDEFRFSFKVTDEITVRRFHNLPRHGIRAGQPNANFLNADLFVSAFLRPCEEIRPKVGMLIFEFSQFHRGDYERGRDFIDDLDRFLGRLPAGWQFGVEIRNRGFLRPEYFAVLARHGVAHVFNSWERMPPVGEQMAMEGSRTSPDFAGARFLLRPGRSYRQAVEAFSPYDSVRDPFEQAREDGARLIRELRSRGRRPSYLYINNRLEGNALETIRAMIEAAAGAPPPAAMD